jgi:uncharacterized membrane protein HdeD (DUF308 family)
MIDQAAPEVGAPKVARRPLPAQNWGWFLFRGILALVLGVLAILFPFSAVIVFALVFAAFAFVDGIVLLISGIRGVTHHGEHWGALIVAGLIGIAVGVIYVLWPMLSTISYALVTLALLAAWALSTGVFQIAAAIRLRKEIEGEWLLVLSGALSVILGLAILAFMWWVPGASIVSVGWVIGVYALINGFALVMLALRLRKVGES